MKYSQEEIQEAKDFQNSEKCDGFFCDMCVFCEVCNEIFGLGVNYEHEFIC